MRDVDKEPLEQKPLTCRFPFPCLPRPSRLVFTQLFLLLIVLMFFDSGGTASVGFVFQGRNHEWLCTLCAGGHC